MGGPGGPGSPQEGDRRRVMSKAGKPMSDEEFNRRLSHVVQKLQGAKRVMQGGVPEEKAKNLLQGTQDLLKEIEAENDPVEKANLEAFLEMGLKQVKQEVSE